MSRRKILIRFDDICPTMDWKEWNKAKNLLDNINAKALIGVIPDCQDTELMIEDPIPNFWEYIRQLQEQGHTIAMHGYHHVFSLKADGLITSNKISEFAGLTFEEQLEKIQRGKGIMNENGIYTDIFFAPAHSYDNNTLRALSECGFRFISDGLSDRPYRKNGITLLPCRTGGIPKIKSSGYITAVVHTSEWSRQDKSKEYIRFQRLCELYSGEIVPFNEFSKWKCGIAVFQIIIEKIYYFTFNNIVPILIRMKQFLNKI